MQDEKVLKEDNKQPHCVTEHPGFVKVCLNRWSLELAGRSFKTRDWIRREVSTLSFYEQSSRCCVCVVRSLLSAALICHRLGMTHLCSCSRQAAKNVPYDYGAKEMKYAQEQYGVL